MILLCWLQGDWYEVHLKLFMYQEVDNNSGSSHYTAFQNTNLNHNYNLRLLYVPLLCFHVTSCESNAHTTDLLMWGSLRLTPITIIIVLLHIRSYLVHHLIVIQWAWVVCLLQCTYCIEQVFKWNCILIKYTCIIFRCYWFRRKMSPN